jgi:urease accessory protein
VTVTPTTAGATTAGVAAAGATPVAGTGAPTTRAVRAVARIRAVADGRGGTALPLLTGDGPLALRRTGAGTATDVAHVTVVGAMSAPLGGDRLRIEAEAGAGARLTVGASAATLSLPGASGEPAAYDVRLTIGEGAEMRWLPEPVIAARGSDLRMTTRVELAPGARLLLREEQILGRYGEPTGRLSTRLTVCRDGRTLLDQELSFGPGAAPGWDGPAGLGGHRAVGQLLFVATDVAPLAAEVPSLAREDGLVTLTPLAGPAALVTALAPDGRRLRRLLDPFLHRLAASPPAPR